MKQKWCALLTKDWMVRAMKTFVQACIGAVAILAPTQDWNAVESALVAVLIGAVSAGGAAVWNLVLAYFCVSKDSGAAPTQSGQDRAADE